MVLALVRLRGTRYSVPARYCGCRVEVEAHAGTINIGFGDLVIASHPEQRDAPGARVEQPEHVQERWECSLANGPAARPLCDFHFEGDAAGLERPLSAYDQEAHLAISATRYEHLAKEGLESLGHTTAVTLLDQIARQAA